MSATIRNAPSGENTSPQDSDAFPVTGSQYMQLSTLSGYVNDNIYDSDILFTDNTTNDADSDTHGYLPKLSGDSGDWLDGQGAWTTPEDANIVFNDNVTNDASISKHGYLPKLPNDSDQYLDGVGAWGTPPFISSVADSDIIFTDITTNDASATKHGFLPKLSNDSDTWLDGTGNWTTPPGGAGGTQYRSHATVTDTDSDNADGWKFATISSNPVLVLTNLE